MSTEMIVRHCAPTLTGVKVGNLFSCRYDDVKTLFREVAARNRLLNSKGVYFRIMRCGNGVALIYVYRRKQLQQILADRDIQRFLSQYGYGGMEAGECLLRLQQRLLQDEFPHEVGVFLGYPLADIEAFIANKGANCKYIGCWKVYTDVVAAKKKFDLFKRCTAVCTRRYFEGTELAGLTVAGA